MRPTPAVLGGCSTRDQIGVLHAVPRLPVPERVIRAPDAGVGDLPWDVPLGQWHDHGAPVHALPVGPSRHLVRFVHVDGALWAVKELPSRLAVHEDAVLARLSRMGLPVVRPAGYVRQRSTGEGLLLTRFMSSAWQLRAVLARLDVARADVRGPLLDLVVELLLELHDAGVLWGDCSLANTLLRWDAGRLRPCLVDAETTEVHDALSDGQRRQDLDIAVENIAGGLLDLAHAGSAPDASFATTLFDAARGLRDGYEKRRTSAMDLAKRSNRAHDGVRTDSELGRAIDALAREADAAPLAR